LITKANWPVPWNSPVFVNHEVHEEKNDQNTPNKKFLEVSEPFCKKVLTRRRHKSTMDFGSCVNLQNEPDYDKKVD